MQVPTTELYATCKKAHRVRPSIHQEGISWQDHFAITTAWQDHSATATARPYLGDVVNWFGLPLRHSTPATRPSDIHGALEFGNERLLQAENPGRLVPQSGRQCGRRKQVLLSEPFFSTPFPLEDDENDDGDDVDDDEKSDTDADGHVVGVGETGATGVVRGGSQQGVHGAWNEVGSARSDCMYVRMYVCTDRLYIWRFRKFISWFASG